METPHAAFDNDKYIALQSAAIRERAERFGNKLYLEIGGKLLKDLHAARVLPGFEPDVKLRMLQTLGDQIEFIVCAYAGDIEHQRYRADFGTTYDAEVLRLVEDVRARGLAVRSVVLTRFDPSMTAAAAFAERLRREGLSVYLHSAIPGYPADVDRILSDDGFGRNPMVETTAPIVGVIAPGPSSGKLATALSQVWHENRRGVGAGYAKYETFPVWNLPLSHAVNIAYEAATADIEDFNQIDPFHLEAYGETTVNYNRDVAAFPILRALLERLLPADQVYRSPTDMGVNKVGFAIADDERVQEASRQEIVRRFLKGGSDLALGRATEATMKRLRSIMAAAGLKDTDRPVVVPAREAAAAGAAAGSALANRIAEYVRIHADRPLTVADVARQFGYNPDHIGKLFRASFRVGLKEHIDQQRLRLARDLLLTTELSVKEIAARLGWRNENLFVKFFVYHEEISPARFRNRWRGTHWNNH